MPVTAKGMTIDTKDWEEAHRKKPEKDGHGFWRVQASHEGQSYAIETSGPWEEARDYAEGRIVSWFREKFRKSVEPHARLVPGTVPKKAKDEEDS